MEKRIVSCLQGFKSIKFDLDCNPEKLEYALKYFKPSLNFYSLKKAKEDKVEIETQYFNINKGISKQKFFSKIVKNFK